MWYILGLVGVSAATAVAVVAVALPRVGNVGRAAIFLRYLAVAGVAAVGSTVMYLVFEAQGSPIALVLGDALMVLGPAMILVALATIRGRSGRESVVAIVAALGMAVVTTFVPQPASLAVKALVLAAFCAWCAARTWGRSIRSLRGASILRVVNVVYGAFSLARVVIGYGLGWDSSLYLVGFSIYPTTALGAAAVLATGVGALQMARDLRGEPAKRRTPAEDAAPPPWTVEVADLRLLREAYGSDDTDRLLAAVLDACRELDPAATSRRGAARLSTPHLDPEAVQAELRRRLFAHEPALPPELVTSVVVTGPARHDEGRG